MKKPKELVTSGILALGMLHPGVARSQQTSDTMLTEPASKIPKLALGIPEEPAPAPTLKLPDGMGYAEGAKFLAHMASETTEATHPEFPKERREEMVNQHLELFDKIMKNDGPDAVYKTTYEECKAGSAVASAVEEEGRWLPMVATRFANGVSFSYPGSLDPDRLLANNMSWEQKCDLVAKNTQAAVQANGKPIERDGDGKEHADPTLRHRPETPSGERDDKPSPSPSR